MEQFYFCAFPVFCSSTLLVIDVSVKAIDSIVTKMEVGGIVDSDLATRTFSMDAPFPVRFLNISALADWMKFPYFTRYLHL